MIRLLLAAIGFALLGAGSQVHAEQFRDWETRCQGDCRTFTVTELKIYSDQTDPYVIVLEVSPDGVLVSSLSTMRMHKEVFTTAPPVELKQGRTSYVGTRTFFNEKFPAALLVDGEPVLELSADDESHMSAKLSAAAIEKFRSGKVATLHGKGLCVWPNCKDINFSLKGFTAAYAARSDTPAASTPSPSSQGNSMNIVAASMAGNRYGLRSADLLSRDNPFGSGVFVHLPKMKIAGNDRYFIWFVNNGDATALNGTTISLSANAKRPLDMGHKFWKGTGLSPYDVTSRGIETVYGR